MKKNLYLRHHAICQPSNNANQKVGVGTDENDSSPLLTAFLSYSMGCKICVPVKRGLSFTSGPKPSSIYVPLESLTEPVIRSVTSVVCGRRKETWNFSRRTLLAFLLALDEKLTTIEQRSATDKTNSDSNAIELRRWLVDQDNHPLDWTGLREEYETEKKRKHDQMAAYFGVNKTGEYFELTIPTVSQENLAIT